MNEAVEEHHLVHVLLKELKKLKPKMRCFRRRFKVLGELLKHHIEEEEGEMLPKAQESDIRWEKLEEAVMKRRNVDQQGSRDRKRSRSGRTVASVRWLFSDAGEKQPAA